MVRPPNPAMAMAATAALAIVRRDGACDSTLVAVISLLYAWVRRWFPSVLTPSRLARAMRQARIHPVRGPATRVVVLSADGGDAASARVVTCRVCAVAPIHHGPSSRSALRSKSVSTSDFGRRRFPSGHPRGRGDQATVRACPGPLLMCPFGWHALCIEARQSLTSLVSRFERFLQDFPRMDPTAGP